MSALRLPLVYLYYYGLLPWRRARNARRARCGRTPATALFYHRIADDGSGAWTYPTDLFVRQIRWLQQHCDLISLEEVQERMRRGGGGRPAVSITFDDGYADNCRSALPLLIEERIPCTYFVCSHHVQTGLPFDHDVARGNSFAPNTIDELKSLAAAGIEIGAHTRTHVDLGRIDDPAQIYDEVVGCREELQAAIGCPIRYFAFPFGQYVNLNAAVFRLAREAGYLGVCSAYGGYNLPGDDPFHIQRFPADDTLIRVKNWTTVDPRKLRTPRYQYALERSETCESRSGTCETRSETCESRSGTCESSELV